MSQGELIIIALRLLIPLTILRWQLTGGIIAMLLDALDVVLIELIGRGGFGDHYAQLDKLLDSYYLTLELIVAWRWSNRFARQPAIALFGYRVAGVVLFELTGVRVLLVLFPNLFENWWLYCVFVFRFFPRLVPHSWRSTITPLVILLVPKMGQELLLHYYEAHPWNWLKEHVLHTS
jgi:hypothetical protein